MWKELKIWSVQTVQKIENTADKLNYLHSIGIKPENIKISSSAFGDIIYYFEEKK